MIHPLSAEQSGESLRAPESFLGRVDISEAITDQLSIWVSRSHTPVMRFHSMARYIVEDYRLPLEPAKNHENEAGFGGKYTHEEAQFLTQYETRRELLSPIAHRSTFDTVPTAEEHEKFFSQLETFTHNPNTPSSYGSALAIVWRLHSARSYIDHDGKIPQPDEPLAADTEALLRRFYEELSANIS